MTSIPTQPIKNPGLIIGTTLIGLGVLGAFMAKKKTKKKTSTAKKVAAKKAEAKETNDGVMTSQDLEEISEEIEHEEDEKGLVHDAHGNAPLDAPTPLDEPTKL